MNHFMLPEWSLCIVAVLFFAGACFYLYRLLHPDTVRAVYGWTDWENEIGHGICMLAMSSAVAPRFLQHPAFFWAITLSFSAAWFLVRKLTWGRQLSYNKQWWDSALVGMLAWAAIRLPASFWAIILLFGAGWFFVRAFTWGRRLWYNKLWWDLVHFGMLAGMDITFTSVSSTLITAVTGVFWFWFAGYNIFDTYDDLKKPSALIIGSGLAHVLMGVVMFIMEVDPGLFMRM